MVSGEEDVEMNRRLLIPAFLSAVMLLSGCSADVNLIGNGNSKGAADLNENDMEAAAVEDPGLAADDYEGWNKLLSENDISEEFRESLTDFAFESSSAVLSKEDENAVFSPLSLYYALSMLGTGASGETESEIMEVLGIDDKAEIADQCAKLYRRYAYTEERERLLAKEYGMEEPDSSLSLADSLWVSGDIELDLAGAGTFITCVFPLLSVNSTYRILSFASLTVTTALATGNAPPAVFTETKI